MSGATADARMARPEAIAIARAFVAEIEPYTDQLIVAGSLRRRLPRIGDVEIVAVPLVETVRVTEADLFGDQTREVQVDRLDERLNAMLEAGEIEKSLDSNGSPRWGQTLRYATYQGARVDLFTPEAARFGWILLLRTGPTEFSRQLVVPTRQDNGRPGRTKDGRPGLLPPHIKPVDGWLTFRTSGERIETPDERTVFDLFGMPWLEPWERL